jgi:hypothetical protein
MELNCLIETQKALRWAPLEILDPVIRLFEGNFLFLTASVTALRNRGFHVDYLVHAQRAVDQIGEGE